MHCCNLLPALICLPLNNCPFLGTELLLCRLLLSLCNELLTTEFVQIVIQIL